jgi:hypothetical protein
MVLGNVGNTAVLPFPVDFLDMYCFLHVLLSIGFPWSSQWNTVPTSLDEDTL